MTDERIARLEAKLDAAMEAVDMRFTAAERAEDFRTQAIDMRFKSAERAVETAMASADRASSKADTATEKRFDGVNEFRKSLDDSARLNIPRTEAEGLIKAANDKTEAAFKALSDKIEQVAKAAYDKTETVSSVLAENVDRIGAEIIALNALVASQHSKREGATEGKKEGYGWIAGVIGLALAIAAFAMRR